ncbi:MAG: hypothetical protein ACKO16_02410 [Gemmataceae bacterium]
MSQLKDLWVIKKLAPVSLMAGAIVFAGCATGPLLENPAVVRPELETTSENPVYVPLGPASYGVVFEKCMDVVDDFFEVSYSNRYDGRIETFPSIAPGIGQPWKPGSPDFRQRFLATCQSIRHRAIVTIQPADDGGFFVDIKVFKELEDLERPVRQTAGSATFRSDNTVERQFEVIDDAVFASNWIPIGRDNHIEQIMLQRIAKFKTAVPINRKF